LNIALGEIIIKNLAETEKMPVLFIGHGIPLNIVLDNPFTRSLKQLGQNLPRPNAVMVISAHWLTAGTSVTGMANPRTIYDFYGFPEELYKIQYPAPGAPDYAQFTIENTDKTSIANNTDWGLDHASWSILKHIYPEANIPVFEMSLDYTFGNRSVKPIQYHYDLAGELQKLRTRGVLIIGSGNIVHNLNLVDFSNLDTKPADWAVDMDAKVKKNLINRNHEDLIHYLNMGRTASMGIPTLDHYLPMIYAIALQGKDEPLQFTYEGMQNGSVSMRSFRIG
jgi:4,5-DOPA dioxygenase extradiol